MIVNYRVWHLPPEFNMNVAILEHKDTTLWSKIAERGRIIHYTLGKPFVQKKPGLEVYKGVYQQWQKVYDQMIAGTKPSECFMKKKNR